MSQKKAIVISVLANAGLLGILFISAIVHQNDSEKVCDAISCHEVSVSSKKEIERELEPAFDTFETLAKNMQSEEKSNDTTVKAVSVIEEGLIHKLPAVVAEPKQEHKLPEIEEKQAPFKQIVVVKGDSLEKLARLNHTSVDQISKINHLESHLLHIGQKLLVPVSNLVSKKEEKRDDSHEYYTVKCGDNPWVIAMKYHMKVDDLLKLNHLDAEKAKKLRPGDKLKIR